MKTFIKGAWQGVCLGSFIYLFSGVFFTSGQTRQTIISVLVMSVIFGLLSKIYDLTHWPLLTQALIHAGGSYGAFILTAYIAYWFPFNWLNLLLTSVLFLTLFFAIWFVFYLREKKAIAELNKKL